ncbi:MAG: hypothetical protein RL417_1402, partial [Pseudomonadota bacterium]
METFFNYRRYRWFWVNAAFVAVCIVLYILDDPIGGRNGGTVLGYTLGGLSTAGIAYLMWFGIRKRSYHAQASTLKGCLSAHVYLGLALAIIVPLHSAFQFGLNVHTLTYVVMLMTIGSGIWGALNYSVLAAQVRSHRGGGTSKKLLEQINLISKDIEGLSKDKSDQFLTLVRGLDFEFKPSLRAVLFGVRQPQIAKSTGGELLSGLLQQEQEQGLKIVTLINKKRELANQLYEETLVLTKLKMWLYFHLPLSFGLVML